MLLNWWEGPDGYGWDDSWWDNRYGLPSARHGDGYGQYAGTFGGAANARGSVCY